MASSTLSLQSTFTGPALKVAPCASARQHVALPSITCGAAPKGGDARASTSAAQGAPKAAPTPAAHEHKPSRRRLILGGMTTGMMLAVGCPLCDQGLNLATANAAEWGYGDYEGPKQWGELCQSGSAQSPIDLPLASSASPALVLDNSPGPISFRYSLANASYLNTGHGTMQVNFPTGSNTCEIGGRKLELLQYHFHAPSEHSFNGVRTAMEAHLVHRDAEGKLAVVGVMLEGAQKAPRNLCVEAALAFAPDEKFTQIGAPVQCFDIPISGAESEDESVLGPKTRKECVKIKISPRPLLPKPDRPDGTHSYIHYKGSLTTPPCSEGVDWFVLMSPINIPDTQVVEFMRYVGDKRSLGLNSRPRQDLGDRSLFLGPAIAAAPAAETSTAA